MLCRFVEPSTSIIRTFGEAKETYVYGTVQTHAYIYRGYNYNYLNHT